MKLFLNSLLILFLVNPQLWGQNCSHDINNNGLIDNFDLLNLLANYGNYCDEISPVLITEIHYNPSSEQGLDSEWEFIELFNPNNEAIDFSGYKLVAEFDTLLFNSVAIEPHGFVLIATLSDIYVGELPNYCLIVEFSCDINNSGENITLIDDEGIAIDQENFTDLPPWPIFADGFGGSLELESPSNNNALPESWGYSGIFGGSPGDFNSNW